MSDQPDDRPSRVKRPRATTSGRPPRSRSAADTGPATPTPVEATGDAASSLAVVPPKPAPVALPPAPASAPGPSAAEPSARRVGPPEAVEVRWGSIGRSDAEDIAVTWGGIGLASARHVSVELGGLGLGIGEQVHLTQAAAGTVIAGAVELEQCLTRVIVGGRVTFRRASGALVVLAARTDGEVRTLLDWRGALAFGAAAGIAIGLLRRRG